MTNDEVVSAIREWSVAKIDHQESCAICSAWALARGMTWPERQQRFNRTRARLTRAENVLHEIAGRMQPTEIPA